MKKLFVTILCLYLGLFGTLSLEASETTDINTLANDFDPNPSQQDFIQLPSDVEDSVKGYNVELLKSSVDLHTYNPTIRGPWGVYKVNGQYVFCVTPGQDTLNVAVPITGGVYSKFSQTTQTYISRVSSSSFKNYSSTHNTDWLFAGQLIIWDYVSAHEADVVGNPFGSSKPNFLTSWRIHADTPYLSEIKKIEQEVKDWEILPSFLSKDNNSTAIELKYNRKNYSLQLTDTNHVWDSKYAKYGKFGKVTLSNPSGKDNLLIESSDEIASPVTIQFTWKPYLSGYKQIYDGGQDLIRVGADSKTGYLKIKTEIVDRGALTLKKVNEVNEDLPQAKFGLYVDLNEDGIFNGSDFLYTEKSTNEQGETTFTEVPVGKYLLKETSAPSGYILDLNYYPVDIEKDSTNNQYLTTPLNNQPIRGGFELHKVGELESGGYTDLADIEFTVTSKTYPEFSKKYNTDANGRIKTATDELRFGDYHIEETNAPNRYIQNYSEDFTISNNHELVKLNMGNSIQNKLYKNRIRITKRGESLNMLSQDLLPLADGQFTIYREVGSVNYQLDRQDEEIEKITTNENGIAESTYLPVGNYLIKETKAPTGYLLDSSVIPFEIENTGSSTQNSTIELDDIIDQPITGKGKLLKVSSLNCDKEANKPNVIKDCQTPLADVGFSVYQDVNNNQIIDKSEDKAVDSFTTNGDGYGLTTNLKYGSYIIQETMPLSGYYPNTEQYYLQITDDSQIVGINNLVPIENIPKVGNIVINKTGETLANDSTSKVKLDADFTIFNSIGDEFDTITTTHGVATSTDLPFGEYYFQETNAPTGYQLDLHKYQFTIDEENYQQKQQFTVEDIPISSNLSISKVDQDSGELVKGAKFSILDSSNQVIDQFESTTAPYQKTLKYGNYQLCETEAPNGYQLASDCQSFSVNSPDAQQIKFADEKIKLNTTGRTSLVFILTLLGILITLILLGLRVANNYQND